MDDSPSLMGLPAHLIGPSGTPALLPETCPLASSPWVIYKTWNEKNTAIIAAAIICCALIFYVTPFIFLLLFINYIHTLTVSSPLTHRHTHTLLYSHTLLVTGLLLLVYLHPPALSLVKTKNTRCDLTSFLRGVWRRTNQSGDGCWMWGNPSSTQGELWPPQLQSNDRLCLSRCTPDSPAMKLLTTILAWRRWAEAKFS